MPDFPRQPPTPLFINSWSYFSAVFEYVGSAGTPTYAASITWPSANMAVYIPFWLPWPYTVRRVFWMNGSSVTTVNVDFGIYNADGTLIYSTGSTARSGASALQYVAPTAFVLSPGSYYFGYSCSSTTTNRGGSGALPALSGHFAMAGIQQEASALPLPATMTPATVANPVLPLCGITQTASGF